MQGEINGIKLSDVSCTMMIMLYGRAIESRSSEPIINDPVAEEIVDKVNGLLSQSDLKIFRRLSSFQMRKSLSVHAALRARQYDLYTEEFIQKHPDCLVINLGCGLDTRYFRLTQKPRAFYDLDLPEVIRVKKTLVDESDNYKMIARSVLDHSWMDEILGDDQPALFLAEGLFMYLPKNQVVYLVTELCNRVSFGQLVAEMVKEQYTRGINKKIVGFKFKYELGFDEAMTYNCGISDSDEMEGWSDKLRLIDDWNYLNSGSDKLGFERHLRHFKNWGKVQWTARYQIGE